MERITIAEKFSCGHVGLNSVTSSSRSSQPSRTLWSRVRRMVTPSNTPQSQTIQRDVPCQKCQEQNVQITRLAPLALGRHEALAAIMTNQAPEAVQNLHRAARLGGSRRSSTTYYSKDEIQRQQRAYQADLRDLSRADDFWKSIHDEHEARKGSSFPASTCKLCIEQRKILTGGAGSYFVYDDWGIDTISHQSSSFGGSSSSSTGLTVISQVTTPPRGHSSQLTILDPVMGAKSSTDSFHSALSEIVASADKSSSMVPQDQTESLGFSAVAASGLDALYTADRRPGSMREWVAKTHLNPQQAERASLWTPQIQRTQTPVTEGEGLWTPEASKGAPRNWTANTDFPRVRHGPSLSEMTITSNKLWTPPNKSGPEEHDVGLWRPALSQDKTSQEENPRAQTVDYPSWDALFMNPREPPNPTLPSFPVFPQGPHARIIDPGTAEGVAELAAYHHPDYPHIVDPGTLEGRDEVNRLRTYFGIPPDVPFAATLAHIADKIHPRGPIESIFDDYKFTIDLEGDGPVKIHSTNWSHFDLRAKMVRLVENLDWSTDFGIITWESDSDGEELWDQKGGLGESIEDGDQRSEAVLEDDDDLYDTEPETRSPQHSTTVSAPPEESNSPQLSLSHDPTTNVLSFTDNNRVRTLDQELADAGYAYETPDSEGDSPPNTPEEEGQVPSSLSDFPVPPGNAKTEATDSQAIDELVDIYCCYENEDEQQAPAPAPAPEPELELTPAQKIIQEHRSQLAYYYSSNQQPKRKATTKPSPLRQELIAEVEVEVDADPIIQTESTEEQGTKMTVDIEELENPLSPSPTVVGDEEEKEEGGELLNPAMVERMRAEEIVVDEYWGKE
ncbi:hypothetical protein EG329_012003 [Mollisiaceae sp. DMI_Dod_QoI]|nr:hypothetical protein EG329_012003 [Helotiales sp. DMI_Dod_QoI]